MGNKRYPVLSEYAHQIYEMISARIYPSTERVATYMEALGWAAGIEDKIQVWTKATIEEVKDERIREKLLDGWRKLNAFAERDIAAYYEAKALSIDGGNADVESQQIIEYMLYCIKNIMDSADRSTKVSGKPSYATIYRSTRHKLFSLQIEIEGWRDHGIKPEYMEAFLKKRKDNP